MEKKAQAKAPQAMHFGAEAFDEQNVTTVRWLGNAGAFINSRGTTLMIDPLLKGYDLPLLVEAPIMPEEVPHLDAMLITHSDGDHFSEVSCREIGKRCKKYHSTQYVKKLMKEMGLPAAGHDIGESFKVNDVKVTLTPADHAWQNDDPDSAGRVFQQEDFCGFWIDTPDGSIWAVGDSRLMPEQLKMPTPDLLLFDFSDNSWHIGFENAVKLADAYPDTPLLLWHWGCVDAPDMDPFNGDPEELTKRIKNPERALILAPGQAITLSPLQR